MRVGVLCLIVMNVDPAVCRLRLGVNTNGVVINASGPKSLSRGLCGWSITVAAAWSITVSSVVNYCRSEVRPCHERGQTFPGSDHETL